MNIKNTLAYTALIMLIVSGSLLMAEDDNHFGKLGIGLDFNYYPGEIESEYYFGLFTRLRFNETIGLEAEIQFRSATTNITTLEIGSEPLSFSLLYFLLPKSIVGIYVFGGVTFTKPILESSETSEASETEGDWQKGLHGGFGLEIPVSANLVLHGALRYNDLTFTITGMEVDYSGFTYSGGIAFYF
jgi:opacity protein-like surface antigen